MQAQKRRHIQSGQQFNGHFPRTTNHDTVIRKNAGLDDTISLMLHIISETKADTKSIAKQLKRGSIAQTCEAIWNFVYHHIQYKRDKTGIEQVRRPSRSWVDRKQGVDCDCYTVFISSILSNLNIPHAIRITKYNGRANFQHVYPIVPHGNKHITLDCVTDAFDHEVPFSDHKDFKVSPIASATLSGVDTLDVLENLSGNCQPTLALRVPQKINCRPKYSMPCCPPPSKTASTIIIAKTQPQMNRQPAARLKKQAKAQVSLLKSKAPKLFKGHQVPELPSTSELLIKTMLVLGVGYGTYRLFSPKKKTVTKKTKTKISK